MLAQIYNFKQGLYAFNFTIIHGSNMAKRPEKQINPINRTLTSNLSLFTAHHDGRRAIQAKAHIRARAELP